MCNKNEFNCNFNYIFWPKFTFITALPFALLVTSSRGSFIISLLLETDLPSKCNHTLRVRLFIIECFRQLIKLKGVRWDYRSGLLIH